MADNATYTDDISALWGPEGEGTLTPAPPGNGEGPARGNGNGHGNGAGRPAEREVADDVARLARALATSHIDVVRRDDLDALRSELEGAFTHQLAVALYELMAASTAQSAAAEERSHDRLEAVVEAHARRLADAIDAHHRASKEASELLRADIGSLCRRLAGPIDGMAAFQRELRHEVGKLGDEVGAHGQETARQAVAREGDSSRVAAAVDALGDLASALETLRDDLAALREEVAEVRAAVTGTGPVGRRSRWRGRAR